jgi:hypothetical protein
MEIKSYIQILIFIYLNFLNLKFVRSACENTSPHTPADCHVFHNTNSACCYLKYFNAFEYKSYKTKCISVEPSKARTGAYYPEIQNIGSKTESERLPQIINCGSYESKTKSSCGVEDPTSIYQCTRYSNLESDCCFQTTWGKGKGKNNCVLTGLTNKQNMQYSINGVYTFINCSENGSGFLIFNIITLLVTIFFYIY